MEDKLKKIELVDDFSARKYQQSIFANSMNKNTLVVLPTGLGKTIVAIMLVVYKFNLNPNKKILFLAPTKPLIEQQKESFKSFFKNHEDFKFQVLTGQVQPKKRRELYENSDFIFSTPQLIENDLINKIISPNDFSLIIFDEAHRGVGNYAYTFIAEEFIKSNTQFLALTASPASSMEVIRDIIKRLKIEHIEVRKYDDSDVKPYINKTKLIYEEVELTEIFKHVRDKLNLVYLKRLKFLKDNGFLMGKNLNSISKTDLLELQSELRKEVVRKTSSNMDIIWKAISITAGLMKLSYGIELFESQDISAAHNYFYEFFKESKNKTKAVEELIIDIDFRNAFELITKLKKEGVKHPKLIKLKEIVMNKLLKNKDLKIIIFSQYRESAQKIVEELSEIKELKPSLFVGQAKKFGGGLSQKKQKEMLDDFRKGKYNILVSTSVGEEGLDIPKVDLVLFYEPVPSAIRTIQRSGRTGRFKEGEVIILITKDTRDVIMKHVSRAKEKKMYQILDRIREEFSGLNENKEFGLNKFLVDNEKLRENKDNKENNKEDNKKKNEIKKEKNDSNNLNLPLIYVDSRENTDLIKELFKLDEISVEAKQLEVGDIVINNRVAIERKAKKDFVNSILDRRIFQQLKNLAMNYQRPILIIEGEEDLFSIRNLNPNVIRSTLSSIAIDFRIPIIYTNSIIETAQMIRTITIREFNKDKNKEGNNLMNINKMTHSNNEELEKVISSIPRINIITAKNLLLNFKTIKKLINTKEEKLIKIDGIGSKRAKSLIEFFNREYE